MCTKVVIIIKRRSASAPSLLARSKRQIYHFSTTMHGYQTIMLFAKSHIPSIQLLSEYEIVTVSHPSTYVLKITSSLIPNLTAKYLFKYPFATVLQNCILLY